MAIKLDIRDGTPDWWMSPDIWVVPGNDPTGQPGAPIAGQPAYVWAHVENHGSSAADGTRIDFWWADPSTQILRSTAHFIGSANADLQPGAAQDVLCLVPWAVTMVNGGHECLIAVANHSGSSIPIPPPDDFNPPAYPEVAQRNLSVVMAQTGVPARMLTIAAGPRTDKRVLVTANVGGELDEAQLRRLDLVGLKPAKAAKVEVGMGQEPMCMPEKGDLGKRELELRIPRGTRAAIHVAIRAPDLAKGEYALVRIAEQDGDRTLGGYTFIVLSNRKGGRK
jgi:hypothetical protein